MYRAHPELFESVRPNLCPNVHPVLGLGEKALNGKKFPQIGEKVLFKGLIAGLWGWETNDT